jgi:hypothetical protein
MATKMAARRPLTTTTTYTLAHTAQCKLKLAANRPDRNLRFVLGHAFTLDNLMLRIVEIENQSAKSVFDEGKPGSSPPAAHEHYDCTKSAPVAKSAGTQAVEASNNTDSGRGRRISFQDNNARPSNISNHNSTAGVHSSNKPSGPSSPARKRSPPPISSSREEEDTSSDDYDEPETYNLSNSGSRKSPKKTSKPEPQRRAPADDAYSDPEDDDYLDDEPSLGLTRFESASAQPPRLVPSRSRSSSSSDEEDDGPVTPPQLPADVDLEDLLKGEKDDELVELYESVRGCGCHGQRDDPDVGARLEGAWDVPMKDGEGKRLAVVAIAAAA